jgi:histidine ammonia-lyase
MRRWRPTAWPSSTRCASGSFKLIAIEAIIAAQAVDLRPPAVRDTLGSGARRIYEGVRARSAFLDDDRSLAPDFERVAAWLERP